MILLVSYHTCTERDSDATKKTFQGPGYIICPITTTAAIPNIMEVLSSSSSLLEEDSSGSSAMTNICDSIHIDPSCPTMSTCDFEQDHIAPLIYNTHDQYSSSTKHPKMMMVIPLICDCMIVRGCPSSCTYIQDTEWNDLPWV
jgi:hypothetical protein